MPKLPGLPFVRSGVSAGLSANEAFRRYQAAAREAAAETGAHWTASSRSAFLQMYGATRAIRAGTLEAMNLPKSQPIPEQYIVQRPTRLATGYGHWANVMVRPIGSSNIEPHYYFTRSNTPLTPEEVERRALADFEASAVDVHGSMYRYVIEGASFTGIERLTPTEGV